ncbi:Hypothetical predicted protein [Octopus vulgaris]|uniref:Uncharacterized protein n=1 Tax=Octopus vulgaris TaxID=6645 RepID=A0AA36BJM5_OCTVU|nr:Hypothetical predicted protein [Octopus vulgaris]
MYEDNTAYRHVTTLGRTGWLRDLGGVTIKIVNNYTEYPKINVPNIKMDRNKIMEKFNYDFNLEERVLREFREGMRN